MNRSMLMALTVALSAAPMAHAATFANTPISPDMGLDGLTRGVARQLAGRAVFASPYATVTIPSSRAP